MIDTAAIRADFPILETRIDGNPLVYLDNAATTQKPRAVIETIADFYSRACGNAHRGAHHLGERAGAAYESARETAAAFINAPRSSEIIFTRGTTESINLVADSFGAAFVGPGDEIVITEMEHHSNIVPWQMLCERKGAVLRVVPFDEGGLLRVDGLDELITPRTKLVSLTYVSNVLGVVNPVREAIAAAHARDVPVLLDGAQAVQHMAVDVRDLDCDFFAFSGHKMYAGTGIGVLYGKEQWLDAMPPYQTGGGMISRVALQETAFADPPLRFEAGTANIAGAVGLRAAIDYLAGIGMEKIAAHEAGVYEYALKKLGALDGVRIYGDSPGRCGALSFNIEGVSPYDAGMILNRLGIAVRAGTHCAEPLMRRYGLSGTVRASIALYNTREEIDRLTEGLERVNALARS